MQFLSCLDNLLQDDHTSFQQKVVMILRSQNMLNFGFGSALTSDMSKNKVETDKKIFNMKVSSKILFFCKVCNFDIYCTTY